MKKISIANGNYIGQDGQQKTNWVKVGVIGVSQSGKEYVLLDPTINLAAFKREDGKDMVMCTVYDDSQNNNQGGYQQPQQQSYQQPQQQPQQQQPQQQQQQQQQYTPPPTTYENQQGRPVPPPRQQQPQQPPSIDIDQDEIPFNPG